MSAYPTEHSIKYDARMNNRRTYENKFNNTKFTVTYKNMYFV